MSIDYNYLVAANLRRCRKRAGLTQGRLAMMADISPQHLSKIERMESSPTIRTVVTLCECLDISPRELFDKEDFENLRYLYETFE